MPPPAEPRVAGLVLAAGGSRRLGRPGRRFSRHGSAFLGATMRTGELATPPWRPSSSTDFAYGYS